MGIRQRDGKYYIDFYANGRRVREIVGPNKRLADLALQKKRVEVAEGRFLDIRKNEKIKFEDFSAEYLELHSKVNNKSWKKSDWTNINMLNKFFGGRYLYEITTRDVEKFKFKRLKIDKISHGRLNRNLACLKSIFNKAIKWGKAEHNPVKGVTMLKENNMRVRYLEKEEIARLLSNCSGYIKSIVIVALNTGMRKGEILGLKWQDIDFRRDIIYLLDTKNKENREVPMNEMAKDALLKTKRRGNSPYVFGSENGKRFRDVRKSFFTALNKSGIINFVFHSLRHTFASHLVMSGVDLNTVRELLGHKSIRMTLRYSHLSPGHKKHAVDVLNRQMGTIWAREEVAQKSENNDSSLSLCEIKS